MPIKPLDVRRKEFKNSLRGYDQNQVDDFLDSVADEFERTYTDNVRMRDEISNLRERLDQFEDLEGSIQSALIHAEQAAKDLRESAKREADTLRESAKREAELTVREAQSRSHQMLADSSSRIDRVQESYEALREAKQKFASEFRYLLHSYLEVMDNADVATAKEIESSLRDRLDTESIALVHEAAAHEESPAAETSDAEAVDQETSEPVPHEDGEQDGGYEETPSPEPSTHHDADATQPFVMQSTDETSEQGTSEIEQQTEEPAEVEAVETDAVEAEEPEIEPASARNDVDHETVVSESPAVEEVDREEPGLSSEERSNEFFDRGGEEQQPAPKQEEEDNRIFRASRFLRRRG